MPNILTAGGRRLSRACFVKALLAAGLLLGRLSAMAQEPTGIDNSPSVRSLTGTGLAKDSLIAQDWTAGSAPYAIKNIISFSLKEESGTYIPQGFTADIVLKLEYGNSAYTDNHIDSFALHVAYDTTARATYPAKQYFSFDGAQHVRVTVVRFACSVGTLSNGVDTRQLLLLENEMQVSTFPELSGSGNAPSFQSQSATGDALAVSWLNQSNAGNNGVQLEWTWLEDELSAYYKAGGRIDTALLFRNNATRVDLSLDMTSYAIPLLYDGKGCLFYRIRAVSHKANGSREDGSWAYPSSPSDTTGPYCFSGHADSLNWQVTTTYAEEGKRKTVIQYFDGSLRSRQTVTKDNTTNTIISAETFYDQQGRPAIQVLPAPGTATVIGYTSNLNLFSKQAMNEDPAKYFDLVAASAPNSFTPALGGGDSSAAAKYYSSANAEIDTGANKNIPDAGGYPYTVTRYTPDGTGRIMAQSGVGPALKMGSGHETKYYYGSPAQEELDGLFGTDVGDFTHYFKNMVKDANGQMSVSYTDMHGRTIATALAGSAPTGITPLSLNSTDYPNQSGQVITRNLLNSNTNIVKGNSVESINSLLVPATTVYNFTYKLNPKDLRLPRCGAGDSLSYDCMYNLEISITDESGDQSPIVFRFNNVKPNPDDTLSTPVTRFSDSTMAVSDTIQFTQLLQPGSYTVRKTLTISEASLQQYKDAYLAKALCPDSMQAFITAYVDTALSHSACGQAPPASACEACSDSLGNYSTYYTRYRANLDAGAYPPDSVIRAAFVSDSLHCRLLCGNVSHTLDNIRNMMLADMIPYTGQYAQDPESASPGTMYEKYDIFSTYYGSGVHQPFYKNPRTGGVSFIKDYYYDIARQRDVSIHPDTNHLYSMLDTISAPVFASVFTYSWAESLLPYHPEYRKLLYAQQHLTGVYDWIDNFMQVKTYDSALSGHWLLGANGFGAGPTDPLFALTPSGMRDAMNDIVNNSAYYGGLNLWQIACGSAGCNGYVNVSDRNSCFVGPWDSTCSGLSPAQKDAAWNTFKGLYKGVRDSMLMAYLEDSAALGSDAGDLVDQHYTLRFASSSQSIQQYGWTGFPSTPGDAPSVSMQDSIASIDTSRCGSYITQWRLTLLQCPTIAGMEASEREALLNEITDSLKAVCRKGIDDANPFGSSTVAPATPYDGSPRSFQEAIDTVFSHHHIGHDQYCNPFVITAPAPYGAGPRFTHPIVSVLDTCACAQFSKVKQQASDSGYSPYVLSELNHYLRNNYGDTITVALFSALQHCSDLGTTSCDTTYQSVTYPCNEDPPCSVGGGDAARAAKSGAVTSSSSCPSCPPGTCLAICPTIACQTLWYYPLPEPLYMPDFLLCGYTARKCLTCDSLSSYTQQFKAYFGSPYNTAPIVGDSLDSTAIAYNRLYAQYLNARTGLQLTWQQYAITGHGAGCSLDSAELNLSQHRSQTVLCPDTHVLGDTAGLFVQESPCQQTIDQATAQAISLYKAKQQLLLDDFEAKYRAACLAAKDSEQFTVTDTCKEYHYTLYYYDMAGNLVKTVPPKGVNPVFRQSYTDSVDRFRASGDTLTPRHNFVTSYRYNSLNQVIAQLTPDAGVSGYWYDRLGRLAVSRNAEQASKNNYSYTRYDDLGRITEVGQKPQSTAMTQTISQNATALESWILSNTSLRQQLTYTVYDTAYPATLYAGFAQMNLRNRVSYTYTMAQDTDSHPFAASYYSYDVHGHVDTLLQDYYGVTNPDDNNRFKLLCYQYDLISGKVNQVSYQPGYNDAFYHRYSYDAENRVTEVYTSRDKIVWEREAAYSYYKHGPLSRTQLGQLGVQGLDYSYTLQGWLKGINPVKGVAVTDSTLPYAKEDTTVGRDVYGFSLHYYDGDYQPIGSSSASAGVLTTLGAAAAPLYNGNIAAMGVNIPKLGDPKLYNYGYDQLNRLKQMDAYNMQVTPGGTIILTATNDYKERVGYDPNGNITGYLRNGMAASGHLAMDSLNYKYYPGSNQLLRVRDSVNSANYSNDIDNQADTANYTYDLIGNMKADLAEGISRISWTVYGKIDTIFKSSGNITYSYDAAGNRISKTANSKTTLYVRDAQGNVMSTYQIASGSIQQTELHIYGSSRLGMVKDTVLPQTVALNTGFDPAEIRTFTRGKKVFELANHLGNVLATITDKKIAVPSVSNSSLIDHYEAEVSSVQDYYPFGMLMNGRNLTSPVCKDSLEDFTQPVVTSDLNSGTTVSGGNVTQGLVTWKPYSTGNGNISLVSQAIKVDATSTSGGVVAQLSTSLLSAGSVYLVDFDITDKTSGVTSFFCQLQSSTNTGQPYRVLTQKTGLGHYSLMCTLPATYDFLRLRVSAVQAGAGQYFVVDNLVVRRLPLSTETPQYSTDFSNAVMSGVNVADGSQTWSPTNGTATTISIDNTGSRKIKVSPSTTTDSQIQTDFNQVGGKDYIARFTLAQDSATKRIYLDVYSRTSGTWTLTDTRSVISLGSGDYMLNYTLPAGADGVRFLFRRNTDAPTIPYTIDNFSLTRLDTVGRQMVNLCSVGDTTTGYRYGFNGKENDNEVKGQGNEQDYGERIYDSRLGRWLSPDPLQRTYPGNASYVYALNSPVQAVDPDGSLVIFINGFWGNGSGACCGGNKEYWSYAGGKGDWADAAMKRIGDYSARYYDGSSGGLWRITGRTSEQINVKNRIIKGYEMGKRDAAAIISGLKRDPNDPNKIVESVKFVTNSMGAAYERGFSLALNEYVRNYNNGVKNHNAEEAKKAAVDPNYKPNYQAELKGFEIEFNVDLAAFQGKMLAPDKNSKDNYFMRSKQDWVAGYNDSKIDGAKEIGLDTNGNPKSKGHHASFFPPSDLPTSQKNGTTKKDINENP